MLTIDWSKSHNGVMLCSLAETAKFMPEVMPIIEELLPYLELDSNDYVVDVKVHMLMPGEFPCIPNWHRDFVPRDHELNHLSQSISGEKMYLWVSGAPYTEFKKAPTYIETGDYTWIEFDQNEFHRGTRSEIHTWRCFIRLIPRKFIHPTTINIGTIRRHSQVYIDNPDKFRW